MEYLFNYKHKHSLENAIKYNSKNTNPCVTQGFVYMNDKELLRCFNDILFMIRNSNVEVSEIPMLLCELYGEDIKIDDTNIGININKIINTYKEDAFAKNEDKILSVCNRIYFLYRNIYDLIIANTASMIEDILNIKNFYTIDNDTMLYYDIPTINILDENIQYVDNITNFSTLSADRMLEKLFDYQKISYINRPYQLSYMKNLMQDKNNTFLNREYDLKKYNGSSMFFKYTSYKTQDLNALIKTIDENIKTTIINKNIFINSAPSNAIINKNIFVFNKSKSVLMAENIFTQKAMRNTFSLESFNSLYKDIDIREYNYSKFASKSASSNEVSIPKMFSFSNNISNIFLQPNIFACKNKIDCLKYNKLYQMYNSKDGDLNINNIIGMCINGSNIHTFNNVNLRHIYDNKTLSIYNRPYQMIDICNPRNISIAEFEKSVIKKCKGVYKAIDKLLNVCKEHSENINFHEIIKHISKSEKIIFDTEYLLRLINKSKDFDINDFMIEVLKKDKDTLLNSLNIFIERNSSNGATVSNDILNIKNVPRNTGISNNITTICKVPKNIIIDSKYINLLKNPKNTNLPNTVLWYQKKKRLVSKKNTFSVYLNGLKKKSKEINYHCKDLFLNKIMKPFRFNDKMLEISNTLKNLFIENNNMIGLNRTIKDIFHDDIQTLCNNIKSIRLNENEIEMEKDSKDMRFFDTPKGWNKLFKEISAIPFIQDILVDRIARDVIIFDYGVGVTTDDFIIEQGNGIDELLLPHEDFDYSSLKKEIFDYKTGKPINPVKQIDETTFIAKYPVDHAFETGKEIGRQYLDLNVSVLKYMIDVYYLTWQEHIFEFGTMDLRTGLEQMLKYLKIFIEFRIPYSIREHAERCFQLFRWYSENVAMKNSKYKIHFNYKAWKSDLYEGALSCPHTLRNVIIDKTGYVLVNTADEAEIELQQEVKKDGYMQFDAMINLGKIDVYINDVNSYTVNCNKRVQIPIKKGKLNIKFVFKGRGMKIGNIVIDNCEFDDITTEYEFNPGSANLGMDKVTKNICNYFMITKDNFDDIKKGIQGALSLRDVTNRLVDYYNKHHQDKIKGKRLTIKKEML